MHVSKTSLPVCCSEWWIVIWKNKIDVKRTYLSVILLRMSAKMHFWFWKYFFEILMIWLWEKLHVVLRSSLSWNLLSWWQMLLSFKYVNDFFQKLFFDLISNENRFSGVSIATVAKRKNPQDIWKDFLRTMTW